MNLSLRTTFCAVAFATICVSLAAQDPDAAQPAEAELSKVVRERIDEKFKKVEAFKDWRVATVDPQRASCRAGTGNPPAIVQGDLNGDGRLDLAVLIQGTDRVQLIAVLDRVSESMVLDLDVAGTTSADGYLTIEKQGQRYADGQQRDEFLSNDTVVLNRCGQPRTAYFWAGVAFRKIELPADVD